MDEIIQQITRMREACDTPYDSFPDLELYMDQVLLCLSRQQPLSREDEKITSAMVNNYTKAGLLPRANGKKYGREHLADLTVISKLKQVLSVNDCGRLIKCMTEGKTTEDYYSDYLGGITSAYDDLTYELEAASAENLSAVALKLALVSYVNKAACEYIIDMIAKQEPQKAKEHK